MSTQETNSETVSEIEDQAKSAFREMLKSVSSNPAELKFPRDQWGFTTAVRREVLKAASSVRGQDQKHELLIATLAVLIQHVHARLPKDKAAFADLLSRREAAAAGRAIKETYSGSLQSPIRTNTGPVNPNEDVING